MNEPMPLSDITVIDLTIARAGPTAVRQLADWGADVVRVESPEGGLRTFYTEYAKKYIYS